MSRLYPLCFLFVALAPALAQNPDRVQIGRDLTIGVGEKAGDVVCVGCSIRIHGQASGSAVAVGGSITLDDGAKVGDSAVTVGGSIRMLGASTIAGDVTTVGGAVRRDPKATITGDVAELGGALGVLLMALPIVLLGGLIALLIWLVQRSRRPAAVPA